MKFAEIIREAGSKDDGFDPEYFPKCSELDISLYDGKNQITSTVFSEPLFEHSPTSRRSFLEYLAKLEKGLTEGSIVKDSMSVLITAHVVIIDYKTSFLCPLFRCTDSQ